ncbi:MULTISPECIES: CHC2 zinc finger domain-containing protein [Peptostreptococcaceae]|uniref:CHC2 zinc finger domain-containing protein n=1 Tax=Terrisporobacter muris TaxID=2963284 RepID=A0A9X2S0U9_9FIRM|nr:MULTISPECIES: CHC2 zinc finger domain-containing protein [Peptostreptococcaceae]MCR1822134.1 CHC2 zinc finger domain-containing protein [Terrisporobacter muris]MDY4128805.1 CHC2 zinc finger domain-containing protein [Peptostreptococcus porci]
MENKDTFKNAVDEIRSLNCLISIMQNYNMNLKKDNSGYYTNCVFHNDKTPSLRLSDKGNRAIYHCFGCGEQGDIINFICKMENIDNITALRKAYDILGRELKYSTINDNKVENFKNFIKTNQSTIIKNKETYNLEEIYIYFDEDKKPLYCKIKYKNLFGKKHFITKSLIEMDIGYKYGDHKYFEQCKKVLYNLLEIKKAISKDDWIFFVEGEKDVETLSKINLPATTICTKKWKSSYDEDLKNAKVIFIGDSGRSGQEFKNFIVEKLKKCCKGLKIIDLPGLENIGDGKNKDVTDWLESGKTSKELLQIVKKSLNILDKNTLQQDEDGIYEVIDKIENEEVKESRRYLTNFQIIDVTLYRNEDNKDQIIKLNIKSNHRQSIIEADARLCFSDLKIFRRYLGIDYIFYGEIQDLTKLHQWIINYFIKEDISIFTRSGIRKINDEYVLVTNKGTLKSNGEFDITRKSINTIHNIDFTNLDILNKDEAEILSKYLFNFNSKENIYNTLGLGAANILNTFARESSMNNLPILQDLGESKSGKSKVLKILRLLFNDTNPGISLSVLTDFELLKYFDETYLPVFLDEVNISKVDNCKINFLSNHIRAIVEGYENTKVTENSTLQKFTYNASLIISGDEEIQETAIKSRSNIVWYTRSDFTREGKESVEFLCNSEDGSNLLRRFSKSLYLRVLNYYIDGAFDNEYLVTRFKYDFDEKLYLSNSTEINTAIYTMMGLELIYNTFESLGVNMNNIINLEEASNIIINNLKCNVLEESQNEFKSDYEKLLEDINNLIYIPDRKIRLEENVHYRILPDNIHIAFDFKSIYDKLNNYYKQYKNDSEKLLNYNTFIKMISKSEYIADLDPKKHYRAVKIKALVEDKNGFPDYIIKHKMMFILKIDKVKKLEMDNILPIDYNEG